MITFLFGCIIGIALTVVGITFIVALGVLK